MIQRIVCRADLSMELAEILTRDIRTAIKNLNAKTLKLKREAIGEDSINSVHKLKPYGFTH